MHDRVGTRLRVQLANVTFTSGADSVTAHGFPGAPGSGAGTSNLTQKLIAPNGVSESGIGVQSSNTSTSCTDSDCEIFAPQSVSVTRLGSTLITDALIGSVQAGETFNFFVETTDGGAFTLLAANVTNTCIGPGFSVAGTDLCRWDAPPGQTRFGVAVQGVSGDELLTQFRPWQCRGRLWVRDCRVLWRLAVAFSPWHVAVVSSSPRFSAKLLQ
jgi:hypothetical protein